MTSSQHPDGGRAETTRQRIIDAAMTCAGKWGSDKTSIHDIAREAGVSRPTVYAYFDNREAIFHTAMLASAYRFGETLLEHVRRFDCAEDRLLEGFLFCLGRLPEESHLALISDQRLASIVNDQALSTKEGRDICRGLLTEMLVDRPELQPHLDEIAEFCVRLLLSLLTLSGPVERTPEELRGFLERRLLPAAGLRVPR